MCGLCGFNDGDKTNDFKTSQGATTTNMATFGSSWKESSAGGKYIYRIHPETVKSVILENVCKGGNDFQDFMIYSSIINTKFWISLMSYQGNLSLSLSLSLSL